MAWLLPTEGGWWPGGPSDPNPTLHGVTQATFSAFLGDAPFRSVQTMTDDEMDTIYRTRYWVPADCPNEPWPLSLAIFDTAVNCGVKTAIQIANQTSDVAEYIRKRGDYYKALAIAKPNLAPNLPGWLARNQKLAMTCGVSL